MCIVLTTDNIVVRSVTMTEIIQSVFNEISLERDPSIWHSYRDDHQMLEKRLKFLAEFPETQFSQDIDLTKTPARKNDLISGALLKKSEGIAEPREKLKLLGQSLSFASEDRMDSILRLRSEIHQEVGEERKALADLEMIANKTTEDQCRLLETAGKLGLDHCDAGDERGERRSQEEEEEEGLGEKHKHLKLFSSKVNIRAESGRGRFLLAGEDIRPGELIARETSQTGVLDRQFVGSNCTECLLPVVTLYPCPSCSTARQGSIF